MKLHYHDQDLPIWGPYSKKYFGISHIADHKKGIRYDLSLMPGIYRRDIAIPDALKEANYSPKLVSENLEFYSYRQQLEWKDKIYCDISYSPIADNWRLIRCKMVNNSDFKNAIALHWIGGLEPHIRVFQKVDAPADSAIIPAADHIKLSYAKMRPSDNLREDGLRRGEVRLEQTFDGSAIGDGFGNDSGDKIFFEFPKGKQVYLRYKSNSDIEFEITGIVKSKIQLSKTSDWKVVKIIEEEFQSGEIVFTSLGGGEVIFDSFVISPKSGDVAFFDDKVDTKPVIKEGVDDCSAIVSYSSIEESYLMAWDFANTLKRCYALEDLKETMLYDDLVHQHFFNDIDRKGDDQYTDMLMQPIAIDPKKSKIVYFIIGSGSESELRAQIKQIDRSEENLEKIYQKAKKTAINVEEGKYSFSQNMMAAVTMTNVVYPVYLKRGYIRHSPPGRCWNSLYTWDSGFIGLGWLELSEKKAYESLNTYLTKVGDEEMAFVQHGTPLPVQSYLFFELWNKSQDIESLKEFYPRLRQYYRFLAGYAPSSTTKKVSKVNLLQTWDYFYNSGGWDDYPPQWEIRNMKNKTTTPVITTANVIRMGKFLSMAAQELGFDADIKEYAQDIKEFTQALQEYSYDEKSGFFSYVEHDSSGNPVGFFRHKDSGENYNRGLDGATPLVADICSSKQKKQLWDNLKSENFMTEVGLSTVDRSASYFREDGYWNGSVWMPHQWFFWKAALSDGLSDFAWKIADTALNIWEEECRESYYCFEHFSVASGRGGGWHHFSGLSSPVLNWNATYYNKHRVTTGYDVWIKEQSWENDNYFATLIINGNAEELTTLVIGTGGGEYEAEFNGKQYPVRRRTEIAIEVDLPKSETGKLSIKLKK